MKQVSDRRDPFNLLKGMGHEIMIFNQILSSILTVSALFLGCALFGLAIGLGLRAAHLLGGSK